MRTRTIRRLGLAVILGLVLLPAGHAAAVPADRVAVNVVTVDGQFGGPVAAGGGQYVTAFTSNAQIEEGLPGSSVFFRRFSPAGDALSGEVKANTDTGGDADADVAAAPDGRFAVVWSAFDLMSSKENIALRLFAADGTPTTTELAVTTIGNSSLPAVAMGSDGSVVVVWTDENVAGHFDDVLARRFSPAGAPLTGPTPVATGTTNEDAADVAAQPGGGFVAAWELQRPLPADNDDVVVARFGADGAALTAPAVIGGDLGTREGPPFVAAAPDGGIAAAWTAGTSGSSAFWRRFAADLTPLTPTTPVAPSEPSISQSASGIALLADGSATVAWDRIAGTGADPVLRRFGANGAPTGAAQQGTSTSSGYQTGGKVAVQPDGATALVWTAAGPPDGVGDGSDDGVFARFFTGSGGDAQPPAPPGPPGPPSGSPTGSPAPLPGPKPVQTPKRPTFNTLVTLPSAKRCVSRRHFQIHLHRPAGERIARATVVLGKRTVATRAGKRITATIDLRGLPKGRFTIRLTVRTTLGRDLAGSRTYRTCATRRTSKRAPRR